MDNIKKLKTWISNLEQRMQSLNSSKRLPVVIFIIAYSISFYLLVCMLDNRNTCISVGTLISIVSRVFKIM